jgi:AcrR family transcriptional regulator
MPTKLGAVAELYPIRTKQRLETRNRVFEAAIREFRRVGVPAAQVEDIVRRAGVARGTFYLHFPTKDHVLLELLRRDQAEVAARLEGMLGRPARAFLRSAVDLLVEEVRREGPALSREMFTMVGRHATAMEGEEMALPDVVTRFFRAAQGRGEVRTDLAAEELTAVFLPGVFGLLLFKSDPPSRGLRATLHHGVDVFVRGVAP